MNNNKVILFFCMLVLMVFVLTPRYPVIAQGYFGEQVRDPHVARIPLNNGQNLMGLLGVPTYQAGGYWQLVMIEQEPIVESYEGFQERNGMKYLCQRLNTTWENDHVEQSVTWFQQQIPDNPNINFCEPGNASFSFFWTPPPNIIYPDRDVNIIVTLTTNEYYESALSITGRRSTGRIQIGLQIGGISDTFWGDTWDSGRMSKGRKELICDVWHQYEPGSKNCEKTSFTVGPKFPEQGEWADRMEIQIRIFGTPGYNDYIWTESGIETIYNSYGSFTYIYEWVEGEAIVAAPTDQQEPRLQKTDLPSFVQPEIIIPSPPPSDDGGLWAVVIGGLAIMGVAAAGIGAVGVAGAAAVLVRRAKAKRPEIQQDKLDDQEIVGYILELSTNQIFLQEKRPQSVRVTCWKVRASGAYERAPEAAIAVQAPPPLSNITVSPLSGQGSMDVQFNLVGESNAETHQVVIVATGGGESTSAAVTINLMPALEMTLTTYDGNTHLEIGAEGLWACAQIISDSASPSNSPDLRTPNIRFRVEGPNAGWIEMGQPIYRDKWQWVSVSARPPHHGAQLERGNPVLIAEYQEEQNKIHLQAHMILELQTEYQLRVKLFDAKSAEIEYHQGQATWQAPDLQVYWVNPSLGDTPVEPDFDYGFDDPPLRIDLPCLSLVSFTEHAPHQYRMQFQVAQDLEQYFGEDLVEHNGMVKITVEAIDDEREKHFAEHDFQVRPVAIPLIYFWQETPGQKVEQREHYGVSLTEGELISDGEDSLGVSAFLVRLDRMGDFQLAYEHPLALSQPPGAELSGVNSSKYRLHEEPENENPHRYAGRVKTDKEEPVFYLSQEHELSVRVNLALDQQRYPNYFFNQHPSLMRAGVKPIEVYLKLWVLPGADIGTSDAGGFLYLPTKKAPLVGKELTLDIESSGGASLSTRQAVIKTDENGLARWRLDYHGLTWRNYGKVVFTIRCGLPSSNGGFVGTQAKIDIGYNVHKTLSDLHAQRKNKTPPNNLDLDNPEWERGSDFRASLGDWLFPDFLSGPCVNFVGFFTGKEHYVCSELRDRVIEWLQHRRYASYNSKYEGFNEEKHMSMNGIEYGNYGIWFLGPVDHNFAGIFLSNKNADPLDDPRFPDPWWEQHWSSEKVKYPNGMYTKAQEHALQASTLAIKGVLAFLVTAFIGWKLGPAMVASLKPKLKYIFTGMALTNSLVGVYHKEEVTRCNQNLEQARRSCLGEPFNRVEPIIRW